MAPAADTRIRMLDASSAGVLARVADEVFDHEVDPALVREFLSDPRHHLAVAVAVADDVVVGFASAVHYVHPDKPPELWINEVGVAPAQQRQGIGRRLMSALFAEARRLGCREAWVLTEVANGGAQRFYEALGGAALPSVMYGFDLEVER